MTLCVILRNQKGNEGSIKMFLLGKFKISGHSMEPALKNGQEVLVSKLSYLFLKPKVGDIIAFKNSSKWIIKRIKELKGDRYLVKGDNKFDSMEFGWIERKDILGKVVYEFK